jgi:hypothetical protein
MIVLPKRLALWPTLGVFAIVMVMLYKIAWLPPAPDDAVGTSLKYLEVFIKFENVHV